MVLELITSLETCFENKNGTLLPFGDKEFLFRVKVWEFFLEKKMFNIVHGPLLDCYQSQANLIYLATWWK